MAVSPAELASYEELARELAEDAMREIAAARLQHGDRRTKKDASDWVTSVDLAVERHTRDRIAERFPAHGLIGEEFGRSGETGEDALVWYIDPVDGTTNFVHGLPWASFSLALADRDGLLVGVVADPARGELFSAVRGGGAVLNGAPIRCRGEELLGGAVLMELAGVECWPGMLEVMTSLSTQKCVTRIMGSSALTLASIGAGRAAGCVMAGFNPIDVAAGVLVAREAGATVLCGGETATLLGAGPLGAQRLLAATPGTLPALVELVESASAR